MFEPMILLIQKNPNIHELIGLAWADEVSFDAIERETGVCEKDLIKIMRGNLKPKSFKVWRKRVSGRKSKHEIRSIRD